MSMTLLREAIMRHLSHPRPLSARFFTVRFPADCPPPQMSGDHACPGRGDLLQPRHSMKIPALCLLLAFATTATAVDYKTQIVPLFRAKCYECHSEAKKVKGDLAMEPDEKLLEHIGAGKNIVPGEPAKSSLLIFAKLPDDDEDVMPPKGKNRMTPAETALLEAWIKEGASLTAGTAAAPTT